MCSLWEKMESEPRQTTTWWVVEQEQLIVACRVYVEISCLNKCYHSNITRCVQDVSTCQSWAVAGQLYADIILTI